MRVINQLPHLLQCLNAWEKRPSKTAFEKQYLAPLKELVQPMIDDFSSRMPGGLYDAIEDIHWDAYRAEALTLDPAAEERRLTKALTQVETLLKDKLKGEALLFGAFTVMDGYARFERGDHRVFLGVDEFHGRGVYLDILMTHELAHVSRESKASVWTGWGLDPKMSHDEFVMKMPLIEHLFSEGYSCAVSEVLNPDEPHHAYCYQEQDSYARILQHGPALDRLIHGEIKKGTAARYRDLYNMEALLPGMPRYAHYVWAWQWVKHLIRENGGDPATLLARCSKDFVDSALAFTLR